GAAGGAVGRGRARQGGAVGRERAWPPSAGARVRGRRGRTGWAERSWRWWARAAAPGRAWSRRPSGGPPAGGAGPWGSWTSRSWAAGSTCSWASSRTRACGGPTSPTRAAGSTARTCSRGCRGGPRRGRDRGMGPHARRRGRARAGPVRGARRRRARGPGARGALRGAGTVSQRATSPGPPGRGREPLLDGVRDRLVRAAAGPGPGPGATAGETPDDTAVADALRASGRVLGSTALRELTRTAHAEIFGAGPLQRFLDEPGVTDVLVNGPDDVWVDRGAGLERVDVALGGP